MHVTWESAPPLYRQHLYNAKMSWSQMWHYNEGGLYIKCGLNGGRLRQWFVKHKWFYTFIFITLCMGVPAQKLSDSNRCGILVSCSPLLVWMHFVYINFGHSPCQLICMLVHSACSISHSNKKILHYCTVLITKGLSVTKCALYYGIWKPWPDYTFVM